MYYLRARYYDPGSGRFLTHDPYQGNPNEPVTLHRYLYGNGNPSMYTDPSGEFSIAETLEVMSIIGMVTGFAGQSSVRLSKFLSPSGRPSEKWLGKLHVLTFGNKNCTWGLGGILADLHTEPPPGFESVWKGTYLLFMSGFTIGLPGRLAKLSPFGFAIGDVELETQHSVTNTFSLQGPCSWISLTGCGYKWGASWTTMNMGMGLGRVNWWPPDLSPEGWDFGFDIMGGISVCISPLFGLF